MALRESDVAVLAGLTASLEGYLRLDPGDPTARAYALRHLAISAAENLARTTGIAVTDGSALAEELAALRRRLSDT